MKNIAKKLPKTQKNFSVLAFKFIFKNKIEMPLIHHYVICIFKQKRSENLSKDVLLFYFPAGES